MLLTGAILMALASLSLAAPANPQSQPNHPKLGSVCLRSPQCFSDELLEIVDALKNEGQKTYWVDSAGGRWTPIKSSYALNPESVKCALWGRPGNGEAMTSSYAADIGLGLEVMHSHCLDERGMAGGFHFVNGNGNFEIMVRPHDAGAYDGEV